jgi:hypothetical protein
VLLELSGNILSSSETLSKRKKRPPEDTRMPGKVHTFFVVSLKDLGAYVYVVHNANEAYLVLPELIRNTTD